MSSPDEADFRSPSDGSLRRFEAELSALAPRAVQLDRDRLMFLAGQASAGTPADGYLSRRWIWPVSFSAMSALAASLLVLLILRPAPQVVERIVRVPVEAAPQVPSDPMEDDRGDLVAEPSFDGPAPIETARRADLARGPATAPVVGTAYLDLRDRVLAMGIESWQAPSSPPHANDRPAINYHDLLDSLLKDS
ncbi:MAG TPA: hypothetical protein VHC22_12595 [Pirellulales bacterium]|nr:hypothetical protein [Pirellulales bacterium]